MEAEGKKRPPHTTRQHSFLRIPRRSQGRNNFRDMIRPARFHGDFDRRLAKAHTVISAVVVRLDNIGTMLSQYRCEAIERARIVRQVDAQTHQASVLYEAALDDA